YPRRVARGAALKAYKQARTRGATAEELLDGAKRYASERAGQDPQYTKHPATWLRGLCWLDEPEATPVGLPGRSPSADAETLSISERMAAAAKRAQAHNNGS